jgi:acyl-coenzyme A thioesterase PaaI-like protein
MGLGVPSISRKAPPVARAGSTSEQSAPTEIFFPFGDGGCFGCSKSNPDGLQLRFFRDGDEVTGAYVVPDRFHGAPGVAHGGIVATILDEFSCAAAVHLAGSRVVTGELQIRYERPCPVEKPIRVSARIVSAAHPRYIEIESAIHLDGERLVRGSGKFFRMAVAEPGPGDTAG